MESTTPKIVGPYDGKAGFLGSIGVRFMIATPRSRELARAVHTWSPSAARGQLLGSATRRFVTAVHPGSSCIVAN